MTTAENLKSNLEYFSGRDIDLSQISITAVLDLAAQLNIPAEDLLHCDLKKKEKAANIKMVIMDCDGVLTDGSMTFTANGDELKTFNAKDGMGIQQLHKNGILTGILSAGVEPRPIEKRAEMLGMKKVYVGKRPKVEVLNEWLHELDILPENVAYIGDDISDLAVMEIVGFTACPADAVTKVREAVDIILPLKGGEGVVREWIDRYLL
ncbi:MAG: 3-deoxy-D-manno-octulosonate 8-phosphate phosphatase [Bacteroidetes bacterium]|nr:MAG: 3-deoxy-D-manno-octulosonate 8-phosphate phosphatase [Bacteroidota bacterium]